MKSYYARVDSCCHSFRFYAVVEHFIVLVAFYSTVLYVQRDSISEGKIDQTQKIQIFRSSTWSAPNYRVLKIIDHQQKFSSDFLLSLSSAR